MLTEDKERTLFPCRLTQQRLEIPISGLLLEEAGIVANIGISKRYKLIVGVSRILNCVEDIRRVSLERAVYDGDMEINSLME